MGGKLYGLLGRELGHSWSVPIHQALGCEDYRLIQLEPEELESFLSREDIGGLNVTIPYKREVMAFCDVIDQGAKAIGSVNTLVRRGGKLYGYNTDIDGFLYMLRRAKISLMGKKVLILGSGGASLTAQAAARQEGAREIVRISRSGPDSYENLPQRHMDAEVLINTTPVGMWPRLEEAPVDLRLLPAVTDVVDVIYNPGRTNLLLQASGWNRSEFYYDDLGLLDERHFRCAGGLSMLAAQAKRAEELFFDRTIPDGDTEKIIARLWQDRTNIVLVGMPGCGKTTVGRELARLSGKPLADLDEESVRRAGKSIPDIFREEGEAAFRDLESRVLAEACAGHGQIIATGGGAVLRAENRAALRRTGRVYFINRALETLPRDGRPLSQKGSLEEMYRVRKPLYSAAADVLVDNSVSLEETAELIWREFCENSGD
ncbi:MAG: shikimate kinase [Lawsonibacter sp.]|nr:shikimate kinase [Lawsonibacter sp.]